MSSTLEIPGLMGTSGTEFYPYVYFNLNLDFLEGVKN